MPSGASDNSRHIPYELANILSSVRSLVSNRRVKSGAFPMQVTAKIRASLGCCKQFEKLVSRSTSMSSVSCSPAHMTERNIVCMPCHLFIFFVDMFLAASRHQRPNEALAQTRTIVQLCVCRCYFYWTS